MLEGIFVYAHVLIIVIGIGKKGIVRSKYIGCGNISTGQKEALRLAYLQYIVSLITKVFPLFVAQIGIGVSITHYLEGLFHTYSAVVGSEYYFHIFFGEPLECIK